MLLRFVQCTLWLMILCAEADLQQTLSGEVKGEAAVAPLIQPLGQLLPIIVLIAPHDVLVIFQRYPKLPYCDLVSIQCCTRILPCVLPPIPLREVESEPVKP